MNKADLISKVAEKSGLTKKDSELAVNGVMESLKEALKTQDKIQLIGFGTFKVVERKARKGMNIQTKKAITIPAKKAVRFVPGKTLKEIVNK